MILSSDREELSTWNFKSYLGKRSWLMISWLEEASSTIIVNQIVKNLWDHGCISTKLKINKFGREVTSDKELTLNKT